MKILIIIILVCIILFFIRKFLSKFKFPKITALSVFTGAVKVGKTGVSLACTLSVYRRVHFRWKIICFFRKLFRKELPEEPLLYSNIPLRKVKYHEITLEHILRKVRFNFGSVVFVDEASLLADCYISKDKPELSTELLKFFKLFGHETHCGICIFNSQQISDLHIALRKCTSQYFYIHNTSSKYLPFISYCKLREERYSEDGSTINTYNEDIEDTTKTVIFRKSTFKKYDCCCYSILTDNLPVLNIPMFNYKHDSLKASKIVSFRPEFANLFNEINKIKEKEKDV
ncbi:MAG: hypothetical protein E7345_00130 [Clostridiales bacterium]|nr:hypothetical protein [Clostridiales bacterium]